MNPLPTAAQDRAGSTTDSTELIDPAEIAALVAYFEEGLAKLDCLGLAEAANYICWGLDILKMRRDRKHIDAL
jgi:hypothetical protein